MFAVDTAPRRQEYASPSTQGVTFAVVNHADAARGESGDESGDGALTTFAVRIKPADALTEFQAVLERLKDGAVH